MHETLSKNFIGHIDEINQTGNSYTVIGWVAPIHAPIKECSIGCEGFITASGKKRKDVYEFYKKKNENYLYCGFQLTFKPQRDETLIFVNNEPVFKVPSKQIIREEDPLENILQPNLKTKPELIVVDNFYNNIDQVREFALKQEFVAQEKYHKGKRTTKSFTPKWIKAEFEKYLARPIKEFTGATGVFQYCTAADQLVYHFDHQEYAAMVYLSPNAPLATGTSTYRSKITGLTHAATEADVQKFGKNVHQINADSFNGNNFYDRHNMELVDSVANIYNRMVIFNSRALHAASGYYGSEKENARLFHLFFFNC